MTSPAQTYRSTTVQSQSGPWQAAFLGLAVAVSSSSATASPSAHAPVESAMPSVTTAVQDPVLLAATAAAGRGQKTFTVEVTVAPASGLAQRIDALALALQLGGWRLRDVIPLQDAGATVRLLLVFELGGIL